MARRTGSVRESKFFNIFNKPKRKNCSIVVFDEESRIDFVRGFRERKQERRRRALEKQRQKQRRARQLARKERREHLNKLLEAMRSQAENDEGDGVYCPPVDFFLQQSDSETSNTSTHNDDENKTQTFQTPTLKITTTVTTMNEDFYDKYPPPRKQQKLFQRTFERSHNQHQDTESGQRKSFTLGHKKRKFSEMCQVMNTRNNAKLKSKKKLKFNDTTLKKSTHK